MSYRIQKPYLLFLGDVRTEPFAKTAFGLRDWCPADCVGQWRLPDCAVNLGLPDLTPQAAVACGAKSMVIAVAPIGGAIAATWYPALIAALQAGLDLISGMHQRLGDIEELRDAAERHGRRLVDVRHTIRKFDVASGLRRSGKRLLTVGTDCALGKKYTALALAAALKRRGVNADFRATGQTGILIAGEGIAIDAVVADFIAGAAESLSPANELDHWDIIEGQGSLFHPAYAGVTVGLVHGSQPDALVLCHDPTRTHVNGFPGYPLVPLDVAVDRYLDLARLTNPGVRFVGVSLNTSRLTDAQRRDAFSSVERDLGLPCFDPLLGGLDATLDLVAAV